MTVSVSECAIASSRDVVQFGTWFSDANVRARSSEREYTTSTQSRFRWPCSVRV